MKNGLFCALSSLCERGLRAIYAVHIYAGHLRLIGKPLADFSFVITVVISRGNAVPIVKIPLERMRTAFPLLSCILLSKKMFS